MLYYIPQTRMLSSAQNSLSPDSKQKSIFGELWSFLIVAAICSFAMSFIQSVATSIFMLCDPKYYETIQEITMSDTMDMQALLDYIVSFLSDLPGEIYIVLLASSGLYVIAAIIYCKCFEKRGLFSIGFNKKGVVPEYLLGVGVGALMISIPALVCYLTGCIKFTLDTSASPLVITLLFLAFILQGLGEEVLFRGYLLTSLSRRNNVWMAIIVSSVVFAIFHISNADFGIIPFINITLFGIFAAVFMLKRGSIWAVGAIHSVWNFLQGNFFGISVSGNPKFPSVLEATNADIGSILSGGDFGLEGGLGVTVVLLIAILLSLLMPAKKSELHVADATFDQKQ